MKSRLTGNVTPCNLISLHKHAKADNIASLTKNQQRQSKVLNSAFFVPKIHQAWLFLTASLPDLSMKNRHRILQSGRVNGQNKRPHSWGNMFSRLLAISDTRPPIYSGGQTLLKPTGGQTMPLNNSFRSTVGDYQLSVSLPANAFIREFVAAFNGSEWTVSVATTKEQIALIKDREGRPMRFHTLDIVARFLAEQGATDLSVFLLGLTNGGAN